MRILRTSLNLLYAGLFAAIFSACGKEPEWSPLGPYNVNGILNYAACGGRIDDIKISPDYDGNGHAAMFLACPGGGVWRSVNFTAASPDWQPLTDHLPGITVDRNGINQITAIAVDPAKGSHLLAAISDSRFGLLESTNGGDSWRLINTGDFSAGGSVNRVLIDGPGAVWVACTNALYVKESGGISFTQVTNPALTNIRIDDIAFFRRAKNTLIIHVAVVDGNQTDNQTGIWEVAGVHGNFTWTKMNMTLQNIYGGAISSTLVNTIRLYADPRNGIVASLAKAGDSECADATGSIWGLLNVYKLEGDTWQPKWLLNSGEVGNDVQGGYVQPIYITPDKRIFGGGKGACVTSTGANFVPLGGVRGTYANCMVTGEKPLLDDNGKTTHVDVHCFCYSVQDGKIYMGTDGGIVRFTLDPDNPGTVKNWEPLNSNSLTNFLSESVAFSSSGPYNVLAGHQDNGVVHLQNPVWSSVGGNETDYVFYDPFQAGYFIDCSGGCGALQASSDGGKTFPEIRTIPWDEHSEKLYFHPTQKDRMMIPCHQKSAPARYSVWETTDGFRTAGAMHDLRLPNNGDHFYTTDPTGESARGLGYRDEGAACYVVPRGIRLDGLVPLYRWVHPVSGDHFYTRNDPDEHPAASGYISEGIACYVYNRPVTGAVPLYRFYNPVNGDHFYTRNDPDEHPENNGYTAEGITGYVFPTQVPGTVALERWYNQSDGFAKGICYAGMGFNNIYVCSGNRLFSTPDDGRSWRKI